MKTLKGPIVMKTFADVPVPVLIHPSQFPAAVADQLRASLRTRRMNHKFHYESPRQAAAWLRVHEAYSPARREDAGELYAAAFGSVVQSMNPVEALDVVSLGAGGGQKDAVLLQALRAKFPQLRCRYVPVEVSAGLSIVSRSAAVDAGVPAADCFPLVLDLAATADWADALQDVTRVGVRRVICFFGMLPNFESETVLPSLASLIGPEDVLLVSANLAPGPEYAAGVAQVLPQYDNELTREWLLASLLGVGVERGDGAVTVGVREWPPGSGWRRIQADFTFARSRVIRCEGEEFAFAAGERFQLFFSYRHTPTLLAAQLEPHGLQVAQTWVNATGEEGLFRVTREAR